MSLITCIKKDDMKFSGLKLGLVFSIIILFVPLVIIGGTDSIQKSIEKQVGEEGIKQDRRFPFDAEKLGWPSALIGDSIVGCYNGTYRWIVMANPALIGVTPPPPQQRLMVEHCFCVMDRIRQQFSFLEYGQITLEGPTKLGDLYLKTALKCIDENGTLPGIMRITDNVDNETNKDNKLITPEDVLPKDVESPKSDSESLPDQNENLTEGPSLNFQG
jgi:hypothetical protein